MIATAPVDTGELETAAAEIFGTAVALLLIAGVLTFALLRAAGKRPDAMVVVSLSLLTLVAIVGFLTTQAEALVTLAGAGVGALAGAVSNLFRPRDARDASSAAESDTTEEAP